MSKVDNYVLFTSVLEPDEDPCIALINEALGARGQGDGFVKVDKYAGGRKVMEANVYLFAGNYFPPPEMAKLIRSLEWEDPEALRLAIDRQWDDAFTLYNWDELDRLED
jgi:hypothetical protein